MSTRIARIAFALTAAIVGSFTLAATMPSGKPEYMLVGIDTKVVFGDDGAVVNLPPGNDSVAIVDIGTDPENPKIVATLPLMNSVVGPPVNLMITPDGMLGIVANSLDSVQDGTSWSLSRPTASTRSPRSSPATRSRC
jgi:hypothetical protein